MQINQTIFKSYDIRGIYPGELNEDAAYLIGRAFAKLTGARKIVIGRDARLASPQLFSAVAKGAFAEGAKICDIGQVPTECLYFAVAHYDFDAGVMVTASHNPSAYNGFKMITKKNGEIAVIRGKDLLPVIENSAQEKKAPGRAKLREVDIWPDYLKYILSFAGPEKIKPFKIAVDCSNGVAGAVISRISCGLPIKMFILNQEPDGNFPNHSPNPLLEGAADQIRKEVKKQEADFGFIFDGDADRIFLVDENGVLVKADITFLLLAKHLLKKYPGRAIAYNAICSKAVPEFITKWGGKPVRTQVGFVNVREGILQNDGVMGGELSGHYCFKDTFYLDSGMAAFLILLEVISEDARKVSETTKELSPYFKLPEINFEIKDKEAVLEKIKKKYSDGKQDYLDGVTVEYENWWFNARPSNTEPLLRVTIEADTKELADQKQKEINILVNS